MMPIQSGAALAQARSAILDARQGREVEILVCAGTGCLAHGSDKVADAIRQQMAASGLGGNVRFFTKKTGCHGFCEKGPLVVIQPTGTFYIKVKPTDAEAIVERTVKKGEVIEKLTYRDPNSKKRIASYHDIDFYARQQRIALRNIGRIDPAEIEDAIAAGAYASLAKVLATMTPEQVIVEVERSGLRGRGGGGFATGRKWRTCRKVPVTPRYIICNSDEGDPGAFMDRSIDEGDPHSVLEGMIIGAYAIEAHQGYIYVRDEYPLAVKNLRRAIDQAREAGLLGPSILGTGFDFDLEIARGGGAFVCGESSALMKSVGGEVGEPRAKYIHSVVRGLHDRPTVLNNVETFACVPWIFEHGAGAFASIGTKKSPGTKVFSLVGKVKNTGLVEVPMGVSLREVIFGVGGGILDNRPYKGVQTGGPSGGCLPASMLDEPVDFDTLTDKGSMMGSGGMIVMDDRTCMVDVARYFLRFLSDESCGKCLPCREGVKQLLHIVEQIGEGKGQPGDVERIEALGDVVAKASLCGLGKSAPNPVLSTVRFFREEYEAHIRDHKCPAGVCRKLTTFEISAEKCTGCMVCLRACPAEAIVGAKKEPHRIVEEKCTQCGACRTVCKFDAVLTV
jgi:NADP-reducing hydrogenase subunit HndC